MLSRDPIRVVLIEDNQLACSQLARLLDGQPDFEVVATAACATTGLARVQETRPHVALVDAGLSHNDSQLCVKSAKSMVPEARVVLMDVLPVQEDIIAFIKSGANGFILKDATVDEVIGTIRSVAEGADVVPASLRAMLMSHIAEEAIGRIPMSVPQVAARMTKREREVTDLIAEGLWNKEIARRLNLATYTVKSHVHNILEKLAVHTRLQIAAHTRWAGAPTSSLELGASRSG